MAHKTYTKAELLTLIDNHLVARWQTEEAGQKGVFIVTPENLVFFLKNTLKL